ncbi:MULTISPECIES: MFS transporter [unclassified Streptomyces]|uniref:MFS transporter n=1 Tax=unclassified Streptomyces TaxID=2593676 RepID=UPI002E19C778
MFRLNEPLRLLRKQPYWPVVTHPRLRRILPGFALSYLGDGMALVATPVLALQLASGDNRGLWAALAVAANSLPGAIGGFVFGRFLKGKRGAQLSGWDATLRATCLAMIPIAYLLGVLNVVLFVALLAVSSLLHAWGSGGRYTIISEVLPEEQHLAANGLIATLGQFGTIVGPVIAGILAGSVGPVYIVAIDAVTFAVLAATYRWADSPDGTVRPEAAKGDRVDGFKIIRGNPALLGILCLTFCFYFFFGPVYAALPVRVSDDLHGSADQLGLFYSAFGIGAFVGAILTGYLRRWSGWPLILVVVVGFGTAMLPLGLHVPLYIALCSFAVAGVIWAPYTPAVMALFQRSASSTVLPQALAAYGAVTLMASPISTALGGPLVFLLGAQGTLLFSATGVLAIGVAALAFVALRRTAPEPADGGNADRPAAVAESSQ